MEAQLVSEFVSRTGANTKDALSCLNSWGWDLKKALIDYNDTSTTDYFNGRAGLMVSMDTVDSSSCSANIDSNNKHQEIVQHRKPSLSKVNSIDVVDYKKLYRGISRATDDNVNLVSRARSEIAMDFHTNSFKQPDNLENIDSPDFTFTLPDISIYSDDFRKFLEKDLIECSTLNSLELAQRLNWWVDSGYCRKLWPLSTSGDGNCLLHAASLSMWGFHDRKLTLRTALHAVLSKGEYRDALWRRWRFQQTRLNKQAGFVYSEIEWAREWEEIVALASPEPRQSAAAAAAATSTTKGLSRRRSVAMDRNCDSIDDNATYESLEEIHIFALAHVLRRTIIVVADTVLRDMNGEAMAPIPFGGVYLPFEIPAQDCHRAPLLLTYDMAHFSALVSMEYTSNSSGTEQAPALIPLIDFDNVLMPIQFCIDPGQNFEWKDYDGCEGNWALSDREHIALLKEYLDVVHASPLGTPEDEICEDLTDEEYEKRVADAEMVLSDENVIAAITAETTANGKSKAAKQLQSVAKQFGSIGKSMSKKIKKNIGSIAKIGGNGSNGSSKSSKKGSLSAATSTQSFGNHRILCAQLKAKRYEYQEEMIRNYLECAQDRFLDAEKTKIIKAAGSDYDLDMAGTLSSSTKPTYSIEEEKTCCINAGCQNYGTSATSYMCQECFEKQKQQELSCTMMEPPRYGTGNSKFYTQSDMQSHQVINRLPSVRRLNELDQTLYLSNSTFYNDKRMLPEQMMNGTSFRHGYSPTELPPVRKSSITSATRPLTDYNTNRRLESESYQRSTPAGQHAVGTASVFSPGRTIIHPIIRQTVDLPPIKSDTVDRSIKSANQQRLNSAFTSIDENQFNGSKLTYADTVRPNYNQLEMMLLNGKTPPFPVPATSSNDGDMPRSRRPLNSIDMLSSSVADASSHGGVATPFSQLQAKPCRTIDCKFFGSANSNFYCSKCCQQLKVTTSAATPTRTQSKVLTDV